MQKQHIEIEHDFDSKCPQAFICPITSIVMQDPYMDSNGISYQKQAIFAWIRKTGKHPTAGRQMKLQQLNANLMLKEVINEYKIKFKDQISYQIQRNKFEISRLNFEAANMLQLNQLETPGFQDFERKYKITIKKLQQMVQIKQMNLEKLRKTATQNSRKLQEQSLQIIGLEEALKKSKQRENKSKQRETEMKNILKQRQQELQYLSQKSHTLESDNQILKIKENNLLDHLALQMGQNQILKQEPLIAQFKQKWGQQKMESQTRRDRPKIRQAHQQKQKLMHVKLTPDKQSWSLKKQNWVIDNTNSNVCIKNTIGNNGWLCSSALPFDGEFVFAIKIIQLIDPYIRIGVMEEEKKGEERRDTLNHSVYLSPFFQQIYRPNKEQTKQQSIDCSCSKSLPKCPFQIECHVNRQQNTIAWHYDGKQQTKSTMPKAWKTNQKQLYAIIWVWNKGDSVEMM